MWLKQSSKNALKVLFLIASFLFFKCFGGQPQACNPMNTKTKHNQAFTFSPAGGIILT